VNGRHNSDNDLQDRNDLEGRDREISLGTSTILGIFLLLALLCAAFFGFGYSMGRRSSQAITSSPDSSAATSDSPGSKPSPGSPENRANRSSSANQDAPDTDNGASSGDSSSASSTPADTSPAPVVTVVKPQITHSALSTSPVANPGIKPVSMPKPATASAPPAPVAVPGMGSFVVQVAAVSHQEDAAVLTNALKKRGYSVAVRQTPQDKLLHVQIGPFGSKKEADAMRQRLMADGYNAIVK
jgi:DedD protein